VTGAIVRAAYDLHKEDDDFGQAGTLYRNVLSETNREHLVRNIVGHVHNGVTAPMRLRVIDYWRQVDTDLGTRVAQGTERS
jgi:catalase